MVKLKKAKITIFTSSSGFTLLEALLVVIIVVVIAAAGWFIYSHNDHSNLSKSLSTTETSTAGKTNNSTNTNSSGCPFKIATGCNWYIGAPVLALLYKANPTLAQEYFDHPSTFVAVTSNSQLTNIPKGWNVTPIYTFFDETQLESAVTNHTLSSLIKGVSLDDEKAVCKVYGKNECTPQAEQNNPVPYEQNASQVSSQANLIYLDVGADPDPANSGNRWHAAAFADYVDSQIQLSEANQNLFLQESNSYLAGWKSATNIYTPSKYKGAKTTPAKVIDGITAKVPTCGSGSVGCTTYQTANPADMVAAVKNTMDSGVWGYWLNCPTGQTPGPGPCDQSDVNTMISFLQTMSNVFNQ
jgi:hypothetical protein